MTWSVRLRLVAGLLAIVLLVGALTLLLNRRMSQATSATATIEAESLAVGTDYSGTVVGTAVQEGDVVRAGDELLTLQSLTLAHDVAVGLVSRDASAYEVSKDGTITFVAPANGIVTDLGFTQGGFAQAGEVVATVERAGSLFVEARLVLDPRDFARIRAGAPATIVLPDRSEVLGVVQEIGVRNTRNAAEATVEVVADGLVQGGEEGLVVAGTPVSAVIDLEAEGPLASVDASFDDFLRRVGL